MERITLFVGDLHGNWDYLIWRIKHKKLTDVDYIQVGDFGIGFKRLDIEETGLDRLNDILIQHNSYLRVVRGNHDDPKYFNLENVKYSNILFVPDYTIMNNTILFVGGGISVDRSNRILNPEREPYFIGENVVDDSHFLKLDAYKNVETLVCHAAPLSVYKSLENEFIEFKLNKFIKKFIPNDDRLLLDLRKEQMTLERIIHSLPKLNNIYFGHYHKSFKSTIKVNGRDVTYNLLDIGEIKL